LKAFFKLLLEEDGDIIDDDAQIDDQAGQYQHNDRPAHSNS
jgi:hypothetical protein